MIRLCGVDVRYLNHITCLWFECLEAHVCGRDFCLGCKYVENGEL